jgi:hypothetical protein
VRKNAGLIRGSLERNRLKGSAGNAINAVLSAAAMNFQKLIRAFWRIFLRGLMHIWGWFLLLQWPAVLQTQSVNV